ITAALHSAVAGDEIWVAIGAYTEEVHCVAGVALFGGFSGTESERAERNTLASPTVIDVGDMSAPRHAVIGAMNARLDGFLITGGNADSDEQVDEFGTPASDGTGGGVLVEN